MTRRRAVQSIAASPTLVGAVTTLIIVVAIFLAYNANQGLPFVPTYRVSVELDNAARLLAQNEVRIGGHRIGVVEDIETFRDEDGKTRAKANLKLDKTVEPLPADTTTRVRYRSSFGLKYLELERGDGEGVPEGGTIPLSQSTPAVEFDDIYDTFDEETRRNSRINLVGFGDAFAARGQAINEAVENLNPLLRHLRPVMRRLAAPQTKLENFFKELGDSARIVAPVATTQSQLFTNLAVTFAAFSADTEALKATIEKSPPTLDVSISSLRVQRPFLADFADLSERLQPAGRELRRGLPVLNDALEVGTPVIKRTPEMNRLVRRAFVALEEVVDEPATKVSITRLADLVRDIRPGVETIAPAITVCNYWNYWFNNYPNHIDAQDQYGFMERSFGVGVPSGEEQQGALGGYGSVVANGRDEFSGEFKPKELAILHGHPYGPAVDANGNADCQAAQMGYILGALRVPGQPKDAAVVGVRDIPGLRGTTFTGRTKAPE